MTNIKNWASVMVALALTITASAASGSEFNKAWRDKNRALVLDGYEFNELDFVKIVNDKRIAAFIHKGSDGLPAKYRCSGNKTEKRLCVQTWRRYAIGKELYQTRRALAKSLGLKWGAYHLARPGNPIDQARHFLSYTQPTKDEAIVIDLEDNDPKKWMSLEDTEKFVRYIHKRLGRWPMLYTNGSTAQYIADNKDTYKVLSRLPLWYARYKSDIRSHFPKGNWDSYGIWQFQAQLNCSKRSCPYRVDGTNDDIDVNVVNMSVEELKSSWPMDQLIDERVPEDTKDEPTLMVSAKITPKAASASPKISDLVSQVKKQLAPKKQNKAAIYEGYLQSAIVRGAKVPALPTDHDLTSAVKTKMVNDLF